ncbi:MAG: hypothetical protein ACTSRA_13795 [Promethearchaeota archaeon]
MSPKNRFGINNTRNSIPLSFSFVYKDWIPREQIDKFEKYYNDITVEAFSKFVDYSREYRDDEYLREFMKSFFNEVAKCLGIGVNLPLWVRHVKVSGKKYTCINCGFYVFYADEISEFVDRINFLSTLDHLIADEEERKARIRVAVVQLFKEIVTVPLQFFTGQEPFIFAMCMVSSFAIKTFLKDFLNVMDISYLVKDLKKMKPRGYTPAQSDFYFWGPDENLRFFSKDDLDSFIYPSFDWDQTFDYRIELPKFTNIFLDDRSDDSDDDDNGKERNEQELIKILKTRLARGEITKEEYFQLKKLILE